MSRMKKHIIAGIVAAALLVILVIPGVTLITKPAPRAFDVLELEGMTYKEISFENSVQDLTLGGLIFIPQGDGPFPAAVIVHGSGTSNRENKWYLTLTSYLQKNGVVVLLPDKRGSGKSEGDWHTSSFEDLATDTSAAISFLKGQRDVHLSHIGLLGLSQGGAIAPIVANGSEDVAFIVNAVGGAPSIDEKLYYEENNNLRQMGLVPGLSNLVAYPSTFILKNITQKEFYDAIGNYDPMPYWEKVDVASLVLYGENDTNVNSQKSVELFEELGNPKIDVRVFEGSGHALEAPQGTGNSRFREDAMKIIRDFAYAHQGAP